MYERETRIRIEEEVKEKTEEMDSFQTRIVRYSFQLFLRICVLKNFPEFLTVGENIWISIFADWFRRRIGFFP